MAETKEKSSDDDWVVYAIFYWVVGTIISAMVMWSHLTHLMFFCMWLLLGAGSLSVDVLRVLVRRGRITHLRLLLYLSVPINLLLGPGAALGQLMVTVWDAAKAAYTRHTSRAGNA